MYLPLPSAPRWHAVCRALPLIATALVVSACGSGGGSGSGSESGFAGEGSAPNLVTSLFLERALAVEGCMQMSGSENLRVEFAATMACPTSGRRCCLVSDPPTPCPGQPNRLCGTGGRFISARRVILLPDECDDALEHELVHGLLFLNSVSSWQDHSNAAFTCAVPAQNLAEDVTG